MHAVLWSRSRGASVTQIKKETGASRVLAPVYRKFRVRGAKLVAWGIQPRNGEGKNLRPLIEGISSMYSFFIEVNLKNAVIPYTLIKSAMGEKAYFWVKELSDHAMWLEMDWKHHRVGCPGNISWYILIYE
jgi:hypothetical protein